MAMFIFLNTLSLSDRQAPGCDGGLVLQQNHLRVKAGVGLPALRV
jgi:hypothetical protein